MRAPERLYGLAKLVHLQAHQPQVIERPLVSWVSSGRCLERFLGTRKVLLRGIIQPQVVVGGGKLRVELDGSLVPLRSSLMAARRVQRGADGVRQFVLIPVRLPEIFKRLSRGGKIAAAQEIHSFLVFADPRWRCLRESAVRQEDAG